MQAAHLEVHQAGSHFGNTNAFCSQILQGNFHGLTINPTAAIQTPLRTFRGHYANSFLRPVPNYVPRPQLHQRIKEQLHDLKDDSIEDVRILVVWGLGGAGKSQLVRNYIQEYQEDYRAVFWIEAGSKETIERDYIQIYGLLYSRSIDKGQETVKLEDAVMAVKRWFQGQDGRWLVVLDSADTVENEQDRSYIDLGYFLPDTPGVHVVITSRSSTVRGITQLEAVEVREMEPSEATVLFQRTAKMTKAGPEETGEINEIVEELGHLALAIVLAGSYISVTPRLSSDIKGYLPEYRKRRKGLLQRRPKQHIHRYRDSVLSTWETSFEAIKDYHPAAARLLSLLAFMNFDDIFLSLFDQDGPNTLAGESAYTADGSDATVLSGQTWRSFLSAGQTWTVYDLESAFETLQNYSLIQLRSDQRSYSMHKLVYAWAYDRLEVEQQRRLSFLALELMADSTAKEGVDPSQRLRLVPHIMATFGVLIRLDLPLSEITQGVLVMVDTIEHFLYRIGRWSESYEILLFHFTKVEMILGKEHPNTLMSMNNLAEVLGNQGKYEEAERIHRETLALREIVLGEKHLSTLLSMNNLSSVLTNQGKYTEAEQLCLKTLALSDTVLGEGNLSLLESINNLAGVLRRQGKCEGADWIYRQALALQSMMDEKHPSTLTNIDNLAEVLGNQGKHKKVEGIYRKALAFSETGLGKEYLFILAILTNLAGVLGRQGKYEEAERIYRQALALNEFMLGKRHPSTLTDMNNLAEVIGNQGKYEEAEGIHRETLVLMETVLGKEHPLTPTSMNNLAGVLRSQGKYEEAERIYRQALALMESMLGKKHPSTLTSMNNLAGVLGSQGKHKEAEGLYRQALALMESVLGTKHPDTLMNTNNLATVLGSQGKHKEAEGLYRRTLALMESVLGKKHPSTLTSMNDLAGVLRSQGKHKEAEDIYRQTLALMESMLGKKHPSTLTSMNNLAGVLGNRGKYEEAEWMYRDTLALMETVLGKEHPNTLTSAYGVAYMLHKNKKYKDAEPLYDRACAGYKKTLGDSHPNTTACLRHYSLMREEENTNR